MEKDFSVLGREKYLAEAFFNPQNVDPRLGLNFARWKLLERVIWQFMPPDTYCHLDGYDLDVASFLADGFVGIGRVFHLPEPGIPGDIPTIMAATFNSDSFALEYALVWVARKIPNKSDVTTLKYPSLDEISVQKRHIGSDWQIAFLREPSGWSLIEDFDLSIFLMPSKDIED